MLLEPAHIRLVEIDFLTRLHNGEIGVDRVDQHLLLGNAIFCLGQIGLKPVQRGIFRCLATIVKITRQAERGVGAL